MKNLIESFRNNRLCVALRRCVKGGSSDGSRREGIIGEAAWEVKKKRRWRRVPQEVVDTFLVHRHLPPGVLSLAVRAWYTANVNQPAGRLLLLARARLAFAMSRFLCVEHEEIGPGDCPQMKFQWKVSTVPHFKVPACILFLDAFVLSLRFPNALSMH